MNSLTITTIVVLGCASVVWTNGQTITRTDDFHEELEFATSAGARLVHAANNTVLTNVNTGNHK